MYKTTYIHISLYCLLKNIHQQVGEKEGEIKKINYREKEKEYFRLLLIQKSSAERSWEWFQSAADQLDLGWKQLREEPFEYPSKFIP